MNAYGKEYTVEQYRILQTIYSLKTISGKECEKKFGMEQFERSFKILLDHKLISASIETDDTKYTLTINGINTYYILYEERIKFWKQLLLSKWADIVVAFITAAITSANWDAISSFFINLFTA